MITEVELQLALGVFNTWIDSDDISPSQFFTNKTLDVPVGRKQRVRMFVRVSSSSLRTRWRVEGRVEARYVQSPVQARGSSYDWYKTHVPTPFPCAHKGNPDSIAFTFLFYLDPHPAFQSPGGCELFAETSYRLSFLPLRLPPPHLPPWRHLLPLYFIPLPLRWLPGCLGAAPSKASGPSELPGATGPSREGWRRGEVLGTSYCQGSTN